MKTPAPAPGKAPPATVIRTDPWTRLRAILGAPVSGASLAVLRIALGVVMMLEVYSLLHPSPMVGGRIPLDAYYAGPDVRFNFAYGPLTWLPFLPPAGMKAVLAVLTAAGFLMAIGLWYRVAAVTAFLAFGYLYAIESTRTYWQSYYYVELLCLFLLLWMPAARRYSVDAWRNRAGGGTVTVPRWTVWILRGQLVIAYFYAGVAKINADWILDAAPLRWVLRDPASLARYRQTLGAGTLESIQGLLHNPKVAYLLSYAGLVFDLAIGFLLLFRRTRRPAVVLMFLFHATNHFVLYDNIDWFPLVGVCTVLIFLDPDWPEWLGNKLGRWFGAGSREGGGRPTTGGRRAKAAARPVAVVVSSPTGAGVAAPTPLPQLTAILVVGWIAWQAAWPLRHYLIAGDARFTNEGLSFSWRLKTDEHRTLVAQFFVDDPAIVAAAGTNGARIDWNAWKGERVLVRYLDPATADWRQLPEVLVLDDPIVGERILFNPEAAGLRTPTEIRQRVDQLWRQVYGHAPTRALPSLPLHRVLESIVARLRSAGNGTEAAGLAELIAPARQLAAGNLPPAEAESFATRVETALADLHRRDRDGAMTETLGFVDPFGALGRKGPTVFVIQDPAVQETLPRFNTRIRREAWRSGAFTQGRSASRIQHQGANPLEVFTGQDRPESARAMPSAWLGEFPPAVGQPPRVRIHWNAVADLNSSKLMHVSGHPFYLRRYARRVAGLWETQHGRRPTIRAWTAVSLNHRPYQALVDPDADLANVPVRWFGHNSWIHDLETQRIPRPVIEALNAPR